MRVLICGSRTFEDHNPIALLLVGLERREIGTSIITQAGEELVIIHGGAKGADSIAAEYAAFSATVHPWVKVEGYPADWDTYGTSAGPRRNLQMLEEGRPDEVWAFIDKPLIDSKGTHDMVKRSMSAGIPTYVVEKK